MKKLLAILLALTVLLTACSGDSGAGEKKKDDQDDREEYEEKREEQEEKFELLDDNGSYNLYYYNYTRDYEFDEFLEDGGAEDTEELVKDCLELFPEMELDYSALGYGCSSYCAVGEDGDVYFGRNFDMGSTNTGAYLVVHTMPEDGYESYSTVNLGFLGIDDPEDPVGDDTSALLLAPYIPLDGINSEGVAICVLQLNTKPVDADADADVDMTPTTIIRNVLDNAADVEEALEIFEECNFYTEGYAYHFMIADADGNCVIVEYVNDEMVVVEMDDEFLACANVHVSEEGRELYHVYDGNESDDRVEAITEGVKDTDFDLGADNAMEALSQAHVSTTRWSIVYNLTEGQLYMAVNADLDEIYEFDFE